MKPRLLAGTGLAAAMLVALAAPASAHVTTDPDSAPQGGEITLRLRVPNEVTAANVVKVDLVLPTDHPLLGIDTEQIPGWTSVATQAKLNPPVQTDDGPVAEAVSEIVWTAATGGGIAPTQFQEFPLLVQRLPTGVDRVTFKIVQTYSDGTVVRWIDPVVAGQALPDHPTPILKLTAAAGTATPAGASGGSSATTIELSTPANRTSVSSANTLALIGIIVGTLGLIVALVAVTRRPRRDADAISAP